ncbi:MAG: EscU/YscU/HrcU family type III secretion system export apparatus switch protein [Bryobacterales bacterium]|nr:EscU/YscU/HrcU family type III secretion system export apparatus switch protein [Bryobacterales bacterium]
MADHGQRTEQPTPRRLDKARREGRFPASKEFVGGITFAAFVWLITTNSLPIVGTMVEIFRYLCRAAFELALDPASSTLLAKKVCSGLLPGGVWGLALTILALACQLAGTGLGVAPAKLAPDFSRLLPGSRLLEMPRQNLSAAVQATVLLPVFLWAAYAIVSSNLDLYEKLPGYRLEPALRAVAGSLADLLWKAAAVLLVLGAFDLFRQRRKWMNEMRMTKQEIKEEQKESEGSPLMRMRVRRLQREVARRRMMQQVPGATAVVVNPTHYAVAIRYQMGESGAPRVVAKGKNWLAQRIREMAARHQVPIIENPPLARALYGSAEVGQEIPPHLYQAVAEVLAYIYRLLNGRFRAS